jgi:DNA-binding LacI/PurR family transcriptional regulator
VARVTLQAIADQVGVSRMTVSNAFSRPDQLSAELRERILAVADELGYAGPDPTARALASGSAGAVGLLLSDTLEYALTDEVAMAFLGGIAARLTPTGLGLTLLSSSPQDTVVPARDIALDGALVYSCDVESNAVGWLLRRRLPLVFVDQAPAPGIASVNVDDRAGARAAAQHLIDLGHRSIGLVSSGFGGTYGVLDDPLGGQSGHVERLRMLGWLDALQAAGIEPTAVRLPHADPFETGCEAGRLLLDQPVRPTAVLCFSDAIALGVIRAIEDAGLSVPGDVSVAGFDDSPLGRRSLPTLTTVRQDVVAKGRAAADALIAAIERGSDAPKSRARHLVLPTELVTRNSTAAPPPSRSTT